MPRTKDPALEDKRKREILEAAARCFVRYGFHQASMRNICAEAGLSAGAVYNYFPSKEAIIEGMAEWERQEVAELAAYLANEDDALTAVVEGARAMVVETNVEDAQLYAELIAEAGRNPAMQQRFRASDDATREAFETVIARGQASGTVTNRQSAKDLTRMVMAVYEGFIGRLGHAPGAKPQEIGTLTAQAVRRLLAP